MSHSIVGLDLSDYLGVRSLAEHLGTVPSTVTRMWRRGGIPASVTLKRGPLWSPEEADRIKVQWDEFHRLHAYLYGEKP